MPSPYTFAMQVGQSVVGTVKYPPGGSHYQVQPHYQLFILHSGGVTLTRDGQPLGLTGKRALMLVPGHTYSFAFTEDSESVHSWITYADADVTADRRVMFGMAHADLPLSGRLEALINALLAYLRRPSLDDHDILTTLAGLALTQFSRESTGRFSRQGTVHPAVDAAARFLYDRMADDIRLHDAAGAVHVSPEHLVRLFRKAGYPPPMAYLWELRVGRALSLLKGTGLDFTAIGLQTGFKTPFHFSRKIKEATGVSPTAYRKKYGA